MAEAAMARSGRATLSELDHPEARASIATLEEVQRRLLARAVEVVATGRGTVDVVSGTPAELPSADATVDAAYSVSVLEHLPR